jgi:hypothetical protein
VCTYFSASVGLRSNIILAGMLHIEIRVAAAESRSLEKRMRSLEGAMLLKEPFWRGRGKSSFSIFLVFFGVTSVSTFDCFHSSVCQADRRLARPGFRRMTFSVRVQRLFEIMCAPGGGGETDSDSRCSQGVYFTGWPCVGFTQLFPATNRRLMAS